MSAFGRIRVIQGGFVLTAGALVQAVIGLGAQLMLMRLLVPQDFGEFVTLLAGCSLVQTILTLRLNVIIIRASEAELAAKGDGYRAALVWETAAAALLTLAWVAVAGLMSLYAVVLVASLAVAQWTNQSVAFHERRMAYGGIVAVEAGSQIAGHVLAVAIVLAGGGALALYVRELAAALSRLVAFSAIGALSPPVWRWPNLKDLKSLIAEARGLWADGVLDSGFNRVVVLTSAGMAGAHGAGIFSQSQRLATIPHQFLSPVVVRLSANVFSRMSDPAARLRLLIRMVGATLVAMMLGAAFMVLAAEPLVPVVLGEQWRPAIPVLTAMAGLVVFYSGFELLRAYCLSQKLTRPVLAGRAVQYLGFLGGAAAAINAAEPVLVLAWGLSASYAGAFAAVAAGVAINWQKGR